MITIYKIVAAVAVAVAVKKGAENRKRRKTIASVVHMARTLRRAHTERQLTPPKKWVSPPPSPLSHIDSFQLEAERKSTRYLTQISQGSCLTAITQVARCFNYLSNFALLIEGVVGGIDFLFLKGFYQKQSHNSDLIQDLVQRNATLSVEPLQRQLEVPSSAERVAKAVTNNVEYFGGYGALFSYTSSSIVTTLATYKLKVANQSLNNYFNDYKRRDDEFEFHKNPVIEKLPWYFFDCNIPLWSRALASVAVAITAVVVTHLFGETEDSSHSSLPLSFSLINLVLQKQLNAQFNRELKRLNQWKEELEKFIKVNRYLADKRPASFQMSRYVNQAKSEYLDGKQFNELITVHQYIKKVIETKPCEWMCKKRTSRVIPAQLTPTKSSAVSTFRADDLV